MVDARPIDTAAIVNLGCKVNQSEMEAAARALRDQGVDLVDGRSPADLYLVNTCTVTAVADAKSRQAVRRVRRANPEAEVIVTGCSVQLDRDAWRRVDPAARLFDNDAKSGLLRELTALAQVAAGSGARARRALPTLSGVEAVAPIDGVSDGREAADRARAFVKVQDGCSFHCTYCIIPRARGAERSLAPEAVVADIRRAIAEGHREVVLTGINVGTYDGGWSEPGPRGSHRRSALTLAGLVRRILSETAIERLRLSSIEPQHVDADLLDAWIAGAPRTLPHFHLPLQSGDDGVLHRMGRRYGTDFYRGLVGRLRGAISGVGLYADVIVGFPTEDDAAWERSLEFIRGLELDGLHVFRYSARAGTPATRMAGQVDELTRKRRAAELLALAAAARGRRVRARTGTVASVLFETALGDGRWVGHAEDNVLVAAPAEAGRSLQNAVAEVRIDGPDPDMADRAVGSVLRADRAGLHARSG